MLRIFSSFVCLVYQAMYFAWSCADDDDYVSEEGGLQGMGDANFWWWQYIWLSLAALSMHFIQSFAAWRPSVTSLLLSWNNQIARVFMRICYQNSHLFVGKELNEKQEQANKYILFWCSLLAWKLFFGYVFIIHGICALTVEIYDDYLNFKDISFAKSAVLMIVTWLPHFVVYLIDLSIWYAVWASLVGGTIALLERQGAVRDSRALRAHFMRAPEAFSQKIVPPPTTPSSYGNVPSLSQSPSRSDIVGVSPDTTTVTVNASAMADFLKVRSKTWVVFGRVWNEIIVNLRQGDNLSDNEVKIYLFSIFDWLSKPVYLPLFQTAGSVENALHGFLESVSQYEVEDDERREEVIGSYKDSLDVTTLEAISEAWELTVWMISRLLGPVHKLDLGAIFQTLEIWASCSGDSIYSEMKASNIQAIVKSIGTIVSILKNSISTRAKKSTYSIVIYS